MQENSNVFCKDCVYAVRDVYGDLNPEDIVCCYWDSDGLEAYDYCSRSKKGIYKPDPNDSTETEAKAPMLRFMLDGCDISYAAEAPADMTLAQLLKQCDRIHPDYCACGIRSTDEKPELIFGYDSVDYVRGETGYASCSIDGVNEPTCEHCRYLQDAESKEWIGKCGNKNSQFYKCLRDTYNTCEFQEDNDGT